MAMTLEGKIEKAKETALKKAQKENLDATATQALVEEAVQKIQDAAKERIFVIEVKANPSYCGVGAGGVQFANGKAEITDARMAEWFREHDGYAVSEK